MSRDSVVYCVQDYDVRLREAAPRYIVRLRVSLRNALPVAICSTLAAAIEEIDQRQRILHNIKHDGEIL